MNLQSRLFAPVFWVVGFVATVLAGVLGAMWGQGQAPVFTDDDGNEVAASSASHLLYGVFGGVLFALAVLAAFALVWLLLWARRRRRQGQVFEDLGDNPMSVVDVEGLLHPDEKLGAEPARDHRGEPAE